MKTLTAPHWTAMLPKKPGHYWTRVTVDDTTVVCVREVYRSDEHGLMIRCDPTTPWTSMRLVAWASNWKAWFSGPIQAPPEV